MAGKGVKQLKTEVLAQASGAVTHAILELLAAMNGARRIQDMAEKDAEQAPA